MTLSSAYIDLFIRVKSPGGNAQIPVDGQPKQRK